MRTRTAERGFDEALGARLRVLRKARGLSLRDVQAESAGVWQAGVVGSWERGARSIPVRKLAALAAFYGVPLAGLLPGDEAAAKPRKVPAVIGELPGELALTQDGAGRWLLIISGPDLHGTALSASREMVLAIAETYAAMRHEQTTVSAA